MWAGVGEKHVKEYQSVQRAKSRLQDPGPNTGSVFFFLITRKNK